MLKYGFFVKLAIIGYFLVQIIFNCFSNLLLSMILISYLLITYVTHFFLKPKFSSTIYILDVINEVSDDCDGTIFDVV